MTFKLINTQGVILIKRVMLPIAATDEEVTLLPRFMGRWSVGDYQGGAGTPRKIEEALGGFLHAKKIKEQGYTGNTEEPFSKENQ